mgnify:FL=1
MSKKDLEVVLGQSPLILVAHPDDEVLWAGGLPLMFPEKNWTIICATIPRRDPIRAWKFWECCVTLGAMPRLLPSGEPMMSEGLDGLENIDICDFDCVVTHNEFGEYGHPHHVYVNNFVKSCYNRPFVTFGYRKGEEGAVKLRLTDKQLAQKMSAMECYDHFLEYDGNMITKAEALMHRYYVVEGLKPEIETYDIHE